MSKVKNGDMVKIDFVGTVDGVAFDGGTAKDFYLEIGSGSFIGDYEQQLIGANIGDIVDVVVTFPANYGVKELDGKEAHFKTTIKSIIDTDY